MNTTKNTEATEPGNYSKVRVRFAGTNHSEWVPADRRAVAIEPYEHREGEEAFHAITMRDVLRGSQRYDGGESRPIGAFAVGEEVYVSDGEAFAFSDLDRLLWWRATIVAFA